MISKMRQKLVTFYTHLRQEENLQRLYQSKQALDGNEEMSECFDQAVNQDENMLDSELEGQDWMQYDSEEDQAQPKQQFAPMMPHVQASNHVFRTNG